MEHRLYSDGNTKKICWAIKTENAIRQQSREHPDIYLDKVSVLQSKYIALHVGLFWSIGVFIIKNGDIVRIMLDSQQMLSHLSGKSKSEDKLAEQRKYFIELFATQRNLKFVYEQITPQQNIASKLLDHDNSYIQ